MIAFPVALSLLFQNDKVQPRERGQNIENFVNSYSFFLNFISLLILSNMGIPCL